MVYDYVKHSKINKEYYQKNREQILKYKREYYQLNKERISKRRKQLRESKKKHN